MSQLIKDNTIVSDEWVRVVPPILVERAVKIQAGKPVLFKLPGEESYTAEEFAATTIPATGKVIVPFQIWLDRKADLQTRLDKGELGVWVATHEALEDFAAAEPNLNIFPIIAVFVERFADGRVHTLGNWLRTRYGYKNELRVVGDVLKDQIYFYKRNGYNSYLVKEGKSAEDALKALNDFSQPYQAAVDVAEPVFRRYNRG